ncbi:MAG: crossover junction endodeoxyribonuclease RuvC [Gammaproteobacteria bacterium HGW-Gammaproteobacteria-1]|jgi:crossover junction endodeoxyribonuclease RuvC|nr:MAG: crossover junction endodeoxyribonuclease RuvC [Gammaproteobacteria bacterium HGW-Gammaproteobacteria-1]
MSRILGIDPGSRITGFGIIDREGTRSVYVASGCIRVGDGEFNGRLKSIFDELREVVATYRPEHVAIERVFMARNPDSALKLGHARGAALCAVLMDGLSVSEYTPSEIKQATVGNGRADKTQIQHMVQALLKLPAAPQADAADALAVALCHVHTAQTQGHLAMAAKLTGRR